MVKRQVVMFGIFLLVFISSNAWAHHPTGGAGLGQAGPIRTIPTATFQKASLAHGESRESKKVSLTKHFNESLFKVTEKGLFSIEILMDDKEQKGSIINP